VRRDSRPPWADRGRPIRVDARTSVRTCVRIGVIQDRGRGKTPGSGHLCPISDTAADRGRTIVGDEPTSVRGPPRGKPLWMSGSPTQAPSKVQLGFRSRMSPRENRHFARRWPRRWARERLGCTFEPAWVRKSDIRGCLAIGSAAVRDVRVDASGGRSVDLLAAMGLSAVQASDLPTARASPQIDECAGVSPYNADGPA
jgi:hypothetical protein